MPGVGRHHRRGDRARAALAAKTDAPLGAELAGAAGAAEGDHGPQGNENLYVLRRELRTLMDNYVGVFRKGEDLAKALAEIRAIRARAAHAPIADKSAAYNSNLFHALELDTCSPGRGDRHGALTRKSRAGRTPGAILRFATTRSG